MDQADYRIGCYEAEPSLEPIIESHSSPLDPCVSSTSADEIPEGITHMLKVDNSGISEIGD